MSGDLLEDLMSSEGMFAYRRAGIFVFFRYSQKDSKVERLCRKILARTCLGSFGSKHHLSLENQEKFHSVELNCWDDSTNIHILFGIRILNVDTDGEEGNCSERFLEKMISLCIYNLYHAVRCLTLALYNRSQVFLSFTPSVLSSPSPVTSTQWPRLHIQPGRDRRSVRPVWRPDSQPLTSAIAVRAGNSWPKYNLPSFYPSFAPPPPWRWRWEEVQESHLHLRSIYGHLSTDTMSSSWALIAAQCAASWRNTGENKTFYLLIFQGKKSRNYIFGGFLCIIRGYVCVSASRVLVSESVWAHLMRVCLCVCECVFV